MGDAWGECPIGGEWTAEHLEDLPWDGRRLELLDGVLLVHPSPAAAHQSIAARLMVALEDTCPQDLQATAAVHIRLGERQSFIPDVLVATDVAARRKGTFYTPAEVVLAVEIVSATSQAMDWVLKPVLYAQAGIPHYWVVETDNDIAVHTFKLDPVGQVYARSATFTDVVSVDEPWRMQIPVSRLSRRRSVT